MRYFQRKVVKRKRFLCYIKKSENSILNLKWIFLEQSHHYLAKKERNRFSCSWGASTRPKVKKSVTVENIWKLSFLSRKPDVSISFRLGMREERVKKLLFRNDKKWLAKKESSGYNHWWRASMRPITKKISDRWNDLEIIFPLPQTRCFYLILFKCERRKSKVSPLKKIAKKCGERSSQIISRSYTIQCHGKCEPSLRPKEAILNIKIWFWYILLLYEQKNHLYHIDCILF